MLMLKKLLTGPVDGFLSEEDKSKQSDSHLALRNDEWNDERKKELLSFSVKNLFVFVKTYLDDKTTSATAPFPKIYNGTGH